MIQGSGWSDAENSIFLVGEHQRSVLYTHGMKQIAQWMLLGALIASMCGCTGSGVRRATTDSDTFRVAAVAADHPVASDAGAHMLALGGNAVDAAVAASFTLSVVRPYSCGIGGGGFMVIRLDDDPAHGSVRVAINYREVSPYAPDYYERTGLSSTTGGSAVAIPGTVRGLLFALDRFGTLGRETVLAPAIEAAENGFVVDKHYTSTSSALIEQFAGDTLMQQRHPLVWEHFLDRGEVRVGDRITNPGQRRALQLIAKMGDEAMTTGPIGRAIVDAVNNAGGQITQDDLGLGEVQVLEPVAGVIAGKEFVSMPPPSSGGVTMIECLKILEAYGYNFDIPWHLETNSGVRQQRALVLVEAMKHAFADRSRYLADAAFVDVPIDELLHEENIARMASRIDGGVHEPSYYGTSGVLPTDGGTSHVSVVDQWGGAVAMTETINLGFGSLVGVDEYGFVLNNEMDDFTTARGKPNAFGLVQSDRNLPAVGKRPLSSMSPTIVLDSDGQVFAVAGASGGPRIITATIQVLLNAMGSMNAEDAVSAGRIHHQWLPDTLRVEQSSAEMTGHRGELVDAIGNAQLILRDPDAAGWQACSDPRKGGRPAGIDK